VPVLSILRSPDRTGTEDGGFDISLSFGIWILPVRRSPDVIGTEDGEFDIHSVKSTIRNLFDVIWLL